MRWGDRKPKILLQSGVGDATHLAQIGIEVVHDLAGVGQNYHDHLEVGVYGSTRAAISLFGQDRGLAALTHGAQWMFFRSDRMISNVVESGGFFDVDGDGRAEIQFHVLPVLVGDVDREPLALHGVTLNPCLLAPKSRGHVRLRSRDPHALPELGAGALTHDDDVRALCEGVRIARRILRAPSLAALVATEVEPDGGPATTVRQVWRRRCANTPRPYPMNEDHGFPRALLYIWQPNAIDLDLLGQWGRRCAGRDHKAQQQRGKDR
jgi:choline dehydrogenase